MIEAPGHSDKGVT